MSKYIIILACISLLLALPAFATGVDEVIYGADEVVNDHSHGMPDENEDVLWKNHDWDNGGDNGGGGDNDGISQSDDIGDDGPIDDGGGNAPVPEPATGVLLGVGVLGLARMIRRRKSS